MNYGLTRINNPYIHEYWYNNKLKNTRTLPSRSYMHFYKRNFYTHEILGIEHTFLIRHKTGEYFPFKSWYLSYNNWIIIVLHWFKPNKKKRRLNPMLDHNYLKLNNNVPLRKLSTVLSTKRLVVRYAFSKMQFSPLNYVF